MQTANTASQPSGKESRKALIAKILFVGIALLCPFITSPIALTLGIALALTLGNPFENVTKSATNWLLKASVVGLGFGMNAHSAIEAGKSGFMLTIFSIVTVLGLGYLIGRAMKIERRMAHLVASGTAICGGSAIASVAPAIGAKQDEISVSLATIFILNSIALIIFPPIGHWIGMSQNDFGTWCAIAIHDTSSVVGAAQAYGEEALNVATTVKLARALWIIPVSLLSAMMFRGGGKKISIPYFIGLFILAMLANTLMPDFVGSFNQIIVKASKIGLTLTLFFIGTSLTLDKIRTVGYRPLVLGVALWVIISVLSATAILM